VVRGPNQQAGADAAREFLEQLACELGVVVHHEDVRDPVARTEGHLEDDLRRVRRRVSGPGGHRVDLAREVVDVHLHLVEARRRHGQSHEPVDPDHATPARRERERVKQTARSHVIGLGALADAARPHIGVNLASLTWPIGEPAVEGCGLVAAEVAS